MRTGSYVMHHGIQKKANHLLLRIMIRFSLNSLRRRKRVTEMNDLNSL